MCVVLKVTTVAKMTRDAKKVSGDTPLFPAGTLVYMIRRSTGNTSAIIVTDDTLMPGYTSDFCPPCCAISLGDIHTQKSVNCATFFDVTDEGCRR